MARRGPKPRERAVSTPVPGIPDVPPNLDAASRAHYRRLAGLLAEAGLLSALDYDALALYMTTWQRWQRAERELRKKGAGPVVVANNGYFQQNVWLQVATQAQAALRPYLTAFGLSPAARSKLALPAAEEVDPKWAGFDEDDEGDDDAGGGPAPPTVPFAAPGG